MATYITVEQKAAQQLLEANSRQTTANRAGLAKQEQERRELLTQPQPVAQVFGGRRPALAGDRLAATRRAQPFGLLHVWLDCWKALVRSITGNGANDGSYTFTDADSGGFYTHEITRTVVTDNVDEELLLDINLAQSNGVAQALEKVLANRSEYAAQPFYIVLPVTKATCIIVCYGYRIGFTETQSLRWRTQTQQVWTEAYYRAITAQYILNPVLTNIAVTSTGVAFSKCFVISGSAAREIVIPLRLQAFVNSINALQQYAQSYTVTNPSTGATSTVSHMIYYRPGEGGSPGDLQPTYGYTLSDCRIYQELNTAAVERGLDPLIDDATLPSLNLFVYEDADRSVNGSSITGGQGLYAYSTNAEDDQATAQSVPALDYVYDKAREVRSHAASTTLKQDAYCRAMLLAMGFQPADLAP